MQTKQGPEVKGAHRWQAKSCHRHTVVVEQSSHLTSYPQWTAGTTMQCWKAQPTLSDQWPSKTIESIGSWKKRGASPGVAGWTNASWSCWGWANDQSPIGTVCWRFMCAVLSWLLLWRELWMVLFSSRTSHHEELTRYKCYKCLCTVVLKAKSSRHPAYSNTVFKSNFHCHRASDWLHTSIVFGLQNILLLWV